MVNGSNYHDKVVSDYYYKLAVGWCELMNELTVNGTKLVGSSRIIANWIKYCAENGCSDRFKASVLLTHVIRVDNLIDEIVDNDKGGDEKE